MIQVTDPYSTTHPADDAVFQAIVTRLEARRHHPLFAKMIQDYLDAMQIDKAQTVLDMGCGTGVVARAIAMRPRFTGAITGIDLSPALADVATRLAAEDGVARSGHVSDRR